MSGSGPAGPGRAAGLLLAAGGGRRYGRPKALVERDGRLAVEWAIDVLRSRLTAMLTEAGAAQLATNVDPSLVDPVVDEVARLAARAQAAHRAAMGA